MVSRGSVVGSKLIISPSSPYHVAQQRGFKHQYLQNSVKFTFFTDFFRELQTWDFSQVDRKSVSWGESGL